MDFTPIFDAMSLISSENDKALRADLTVNATIVKQKNLAIGEYLVAYQGNQYSAFTLNLDTVYKVGEAVYVKVPQGDFSLKKLIEGSAKGGNVSQAELTELTSIPVSHGPNWVDPTADWYVRIGGSLDSPYPPLKIVTQNDTTATNDNLQGIGNPTDFRGNPSNTISGVPSTVGRTNGIGNYFADVAYRYDKQPAADVANADSKFAIYSAVYDKIMIRAKFRTNFNDVHSQGTYALVAVCEEKILYTDNTGSTATPLVDNQFKTFTLGFNSFVGNPWDYSETWAENTAVFEITPGALIGLRYLYLTQDGKFVPDSALSYDLVTGTVTPVAAGGDPYNIFCKDIEIYFCTLEDLTLNRFYFDIKTPHGTHIYNDATLGNNSPLPLKASLLYGRQEVLDPSTCVMSWYRENRYVEVGTSNYDKNAGYGWERIDIDQGDAQGYISNLMLKYAVNSQETFGQIWVPWLYRYPAAGTDLEVPWQIRYKAICNYNNNEIIFEDIETVINKNSYYDLYIECTTSQDNSNTYLEVKDRNHPDAEFYGDWWIYTPDGAYTYISNATNFRTDGETNTAYRPLGKVRINDFGVNAYATFFVAASNSRTRAAPFDVIGNLQYDFIGDISDEDLFVDWVGQDYYAYDASGNLHFEDHDVDRTLYADIRWAQGKFSDYRIEILDPEGLPLVSRNSTVLNTQEGRNIATSMMTEAWLANVIDTGKNPNENQNVIHYHVRQKYDEIKAQLEHNVWTLKIILLNSQKELLFKKQITFVKDGNQGTNGGEFGFKLRPINRAIPGVALVDPRPLWWNTSTGAWDTSTAYRLDLRPFVYRNGTLVEQLSSSYTYQVSYDVRLPENSYEAWRGQSIIALYNYATNVIVPATTVYGQVNQAAAATTVPTLYSDVAVAGDRIRYVQSGTTGNPYAAITVRGRLNPTLATSLNATRIAFVKAICDIYYGGTLVSSLSEIYPVDIYEGPVALDLTTIQTNWPKYVMYNATGFDPQTFEEPLYFYYGAGAAEYNANGDTYSRQLYSLQSVNGATYFNAKDYFAWLEGFIPVIYTTPVDTTKNPLNGRYNRTVAYYLNAYGNVDINGWDGAGIDVNEEKGTLFAPTIGAGYKEKMTNLFTGVIMGIDKSQLKSQFNGLFSAADRARNPYMVGIYGYQQGVASFGIMENGTAFFGRADRGGRIWIDGFNAWIYGGSRIGTSSLDYTPANISMFNRMRITLMDLNNIDTSPDINIEGQSTLRTGEYWDVPNWYVMYIMGNRFNVPTPSNPEIRGINTTNLSQYAGPNENALTAAFRRGSLTPAIEIGQHGYFGSFDFIPSAHPYSATDNNTHETRQWIREHFEIPYVAQHHRDPADNNRWRSNIDYIFDYMHIPGYRNFLVTYDGTMWARNAVVQGAVVGSSVIVSRILTPNSNFSENGDLVIGNETHTFQDDGYDDIKPGIFSEKIPTYFPTGSTGTFTVVGDFIVDITGSATGTAGREPGTTYIWNLKVGNNFALDSGLLHMSGDTSGNTGEIVIGRPNETKDDTVVFEVLGRTHLWGSIGLGGYSYVKQGTYESNVVSVGQVHLGAIDQGDDTTQGIIDATLVSQEDWDYRFNNSRTGLSASKKALFSLWGRKDDGSISDGMIEIGPYHIFATSNKTGGFITNAALATLTVGDDYRGSYNGISGAEISNFFRFDMTGFNVQSIFIGSGKNYTQTADNYLFRQDDLVTSSDSGNGENKKTRPTVSFYNTREALFGTYSGSNNSVLTISDLWAISTNRWGAQFKAFVMNMHGRIRLATASLFDVYASAAGRAAVGSNIRGKGISTQILSLGYPRSRFFLGASIDSNFSPTSSTPAVTGTQDIKNQRLVGWTSGALELGAIKLPNDGSVSNGEHVGPDNADTYGYIFIPSRDIPSNDGAVGASAFDYKGTTIVGNVTHWAADPGTLYQKAGVHLISHVDSGNPHGTMNASEVFVGDLRVGIQVPFGGAFVVTRAGSSEGSPEGWGWTHSGTGAIKDKREAFVISDVLPGTPGSGGIQMYSVSNPILAVTGTMMGGVDGVDVQVLRLSPTGKGVSMEVSNSLSSIVSTSPRAYIKVQLGSGAGEVYLATDEGRDYFKGVANGKVGFYGDWATPENQENIYARFG